MPDPSTLGRILIAVGGALVLAGVVVLVAGRLPFVGRLPGDITIRRGPVTFYAPIVTSLVLSIVLTIALNLWLRR